MSGRGARSSGCGGRGYNNRDGRSRGWGQNYTGAKKASKTGLCTTLGINMFNYGHKAAADQMRTSWEKLVQYIGMNYGQDISNKLQNKLTVTLPEPVHTPAVLARHNVWEQMVRNGQANIQQACLAQRAILVTAVTAGINPKAPMKLAILENKIAQGNFNQNVKVPIKNDQFWEDRLSTVTSGGPTKNRILNYQRTGAKHFCLSLGSVRNYFKTGWNKIPIGIWLAPPMTHWCCTNWLKRRF